MIHVAHGRHVMQANPVLALLLLCVAVWLAWPAQHDNVGSCGGAQLLHKISMHECGAEPGCAGPACVIFLCIPVSVCSAVQVQAENMQQAESLVKLAERLEQQASSLDRLQELLDAQQGGDLDSAIAACRCIVHSRLMLRVLAGPVTVYMP